MSDRPLYSIRNWAKDFENSQSRKTEKARWVPVPNKHDGKSFRRLMAMKNGCALYGAWCLIVQVASKCPTRGVLSDDDGPLDAADLAVKTGAPAALLQSALEVCSSKEVAWIVVDNYQSAPSPSHSIGTERKGIEGNRKEGNRKEVSSTETPSVSPEQAAESPVLVFPTDGQKKSWPLPQSQVDVWQADFPHLNIMAECRAALAWVHANDDKRKTFNGMPKFLVGWFCRAQNKTRAGPSGNGARPIVTTPQLDESDFQ